MDWLEEAKKQYKEGPTLLGLAQSAALIALCEQAKRIADALEMATNHLDDIGTVARNAAGPMGAIVVDVAEH